jgi:hypothetical protein
MATTNGGVLPFGGAPPEGSVPAELGPNTQLAAPVVGMAKDQSGLGYWLVARDGGVFTFGNAPYLGNTYTIGFTGLSGSRPLAAPVVGIAPTPSGQGYWLVAADGGVFTFGNAPYLGNTYTIGFTGLSGSRPLAAPIVGIAPDPSGQGYWLVAADGGVFTFGNAPYLGNTYTIGFTGLSGSRPLAAPVVGLVPTPSGQGYWLVARDGGVFSFGDASFFGSTYSLGLTGLLGPNPLPAPVVGMSATPTGQGYWLVSRTGHVWAFGDAPTLGSASSEVTEPVVALVDAPGDGLPTYSAAASGSYGYDVSNYQCPDPLPASTQLGIVETTGWAGSAPNPCLAQEAAWAGSNLELYVFLAYGSSSQDEPGCNGDPQCNFGYQAAQYAYQYAQSQGVDVDVPWWVDVEPANWSSDTQANQQVVQGALTYLQDEGVNTVGVYTSPDTWAGLVGDYQPPVPIWLAWYTNNPQGNCQNGVSYAASSNNYLPTGGVLITQYSDQVQVSGNNFDGDYAC